MNQSEVGRLAQLMALCAAYYRLRLDDSVLRMYAQDLADLEFDDVKEALEAYRRDPKNKHMPLPAMIREMLAPNHETDDAKARECAARINTAIVKLGWNRENDAREFIGDLGWEVVRLSGGWNHLCTNYGSSISMDTFVAQSRELAKALLAKQAKVSSRHLELAQGNQALQIEGAKESSGEITVEKLRELMKNAGLISGPNREGA